MTEQVVHYYGDTIRKLFFAAGFVILLTLPLAQNRLPISLYAAIAIIMALDIFAGITNPLWQWISYMDASISLVGFLWFSYFTMALYQQHGAFDYLFWINGILASIFFCALYFATKTLRGKFAV